MDQVECTEWPYTFEKKNWQKSLWFSFRSADSFFDFHDFCLGSFSTTSCGSTFAKPFFSAGLLCFFLVFVGKNLTFQKPGRKGEKTRNDIPKETGREFCKARKNQTLEKQRPPLNFTSPPKKSFLFLTIWIHGWIFFKNGEGGWLNQANSDSVAPVVGFPWLLVRSLRRQKNAWRSERKVPSLDDTLG